MADKKEEEKKKKPKLPTPLKRRKQDDQKALRNKVVKSKIHTTRVNFEKESKEEERMNLLKRLFSLIDKAAKRGIYKKNKANRLKSRLHSKV